MLHLGLVAHFQSPGTLLPEEPLTPILNSLRHRQPPSCISSVLPHSHFLPTPKASPPHFSCSMSALHPFLSVLTSRRS